MLFRGTRQTQSLGTAHSCTENIFNKYSHQVMRVNFLEIFSENSYQASESTFFQLL